MKYNWMYVLYFLAGFVLGCVAGEAFAGDLHLLELDQFSIETAKIVNYDDSYFNYPDVGPGEHWTETTSARFNLDLVSYGDFGLWWDNRIHGETTNYQYRSTGWEYEVAAGLRDKVEFYWDHHSQHALDTARPDQHFPLWNAIGVRVVFYKRGDS